MNVCVCVCVCVREREREREWPRGLRLGVCGRSLVVIKGSIPPAGMDASESC